MKINKTAMKTIKRFSINKFFNDLFVFDEKSMIKKTITFTNGIAIKIKNKNQSPIDISLFVNIIKHPLYR
jgi:hypothetical protein